MSFDKLQVLVIMLLVPIGALYWYTSTQNVSVSEIFISSVPVLHVGDIPVRVEIARTEAERKQGLSGRKFVENLKGMLFVFPNTDYHQIWMKDMNFPIDIVWISEDLEVIDIDKGVSPDTYPRSFRPEKPVRYILETNAQYVDTFGLRIGQKVRLPLEVSEGLVD